MNYLYSRKTGGFYPLLLQSDYQHSPAGLPDDAVMISQAQHQSLFSGVAEGKVIIADAAGYPQLADPPPPPQEELVAAARAEKAQLMQTASEALAPLQDAADLGMAAEAEKSQLHAWKTYRVQLSRVDVRSAPAINWPQVPAAL